MRIGPLVLLAGSTCYEAQLGPLWLTILKPRYWTPRNRLLRVGWQQDQPF